MILLSVDLFTKRCAATRRRIDTSEHKHACIQHLPLYYVSGPIDIQMNYPTTIKALDTFQSITPLTLINHKL